MTTYAEVVLAEGQLAATKSTLYTATGKVNIKWFGGNNTGGGVNVVKIYLKPGATSRRIDRFSLNADDSFRVLEPGEVVQLEAGDLIEGEATNASQVDYVITGVTVT